MHVADCYIHVRYGELAPREFDALSEVLLRYATRLAARSVPRGRELEFTLEEGSLFHRIVVIGGLLLGTGDVLSKYHDLKESVIEMVHDGEEFSDKAIKEFRQLTGAKPDHDIYKRTTSRDMNRLTRIVSSFDVASTKRLNPDELDNLRTQVIHDLAGLVRANPEDPDIEAIFHAIPRNSIPSLPRSPADAVEADAFNLQYKGHHFKEPEEEAPPRPGRPHRRFHERVALPPRRTYR
jgi:hypothetical protein